MSKLMRQFKLVSGNMVTTCWLEDDKRLKVGVDITLKSYSNPNKVWTIESRGSNAKEFSKIQKTWKVGGIASRDRAAR